MHFLQSRMIYVCVYLRCRDTCMSEQFLNLSQIGTTGEEMRRETVP